MHKLEIYGCNEMALNVFQSYLQSMTQIVQIGCTLFDELPINYGVLQRCWAVIVYLNVCLFCLFVGV